MRYNEILAKKVIAFITPVITLNNHNTLQINIHAYQKRQTLWQLLKSNMESIDFPLIRQFEKKPTNDDLNQATICLLTLKFKEDSILVNQIELFLDTQQDIELAEKGHAKTDHNKPTMRCQSAQSYRTKWAQRRLLH